MCEKWERVYDGQHKQQKVLSSYSRIHQEHLHSNAILQQKHQTTTCWSKFEIGKSNFRE
jgi:hypothetical protein